MENKIRIGIADDHLIFRQGLINIFNSCKNMAVSFAVTNGQDLCNELSATPVDIVFLDINMPVMNGKQAFNRVRKDFPGTKIIMLSFYYSDVYVSDYLKNGASCFLSKSCGFEELVAAVNAVYNKGFYHNAATRRLLTKRTKPVWQHDFVNEAKLTEREIEVLDLLRSDFKNIEIAEILFISMRTVEGHRASLMRKTGTAQLAGLIQWAIDHKVPTNL